MSDLFGNTISSARYIYDEEGTTKTHIELTLTSGQHQLIEVRISSELYRELMSMVEDGSLTIAD